MFFIVSLTMINKKFNIFFITEKLSELNLDYVKKTGAILILRSIDKYKDDELKKFNKKCTRNNISLFVPNKIRTLFSLNSNKFYISAHNKKPFKHLKKIKPNIKIIGSAHNVREIREKIDQGCDFIVLSRIFETTNKNKRGYLGTLKFNLLSRKFSKKFIALGGINEKTYKLLKILNICGCAILNDKKKAGKYMPAFLKNNF